MPGAGPYEVVARRFRPKTFGEIVGQEAILRSLSSALSAERVPHAFLFAGSRGVGKTTLARIFARALNCESGPTPDPCGTCAVCVSTLEGTNSDVVEIDAASHNLVEDIRELRDRVSFASMGSRYKVYILDEVHMLTRSAFNAFLKTLEEPPARVVFILATTELHKVPDTIRSRCQVLPFRRVGLDDIRQRLSGICAQEKIAVPDEVLAAIALASKGGMRDAETSLERVLPVAAEMGDAFDVEAYYRLAHRVGIDRMVEVAAQLADGEAAAALRFVAHVVDEGGDEREALGDLLDVLRGALLIHVDGPQTELLAVGQGLRDQLIELSGKCDVERLDAMIQAGLIGRERLRQLEDRRLVLEMALLRMAQAGRLKTLGELWAAVQSGAVPEPAAATAPASAAAPASRAAPTSKAGRDAPAAAVDAGGAEAVAAAMPIKQRLLARLQQVKPLLVHTLEQTDLGDPDARGNVMLTLHTEQKMHRDRLASPDVQRLVAELLSELHGRRVSIVIVGDEAPEAPIAKRAPRKAAGGAVNKVLKKFDGRLLEDEESSS